MKIRPVEAELFHADRRTDKHDAAKRPDSHTSSLMTLCIIIFVIKYSKYL